MNNLKCCICSLEDVEDKEQKEHYKKEAYKKEEDKREAYKTIVYKTIGSYCLLQCTNCGLVYLDKDYSEQRDFIDDAKKNLKNEDNEKVEYWSFPELYAKHKAVFERFFRERLERINKNHPNPGTILDVGCGYGFWMDYCRRNGLTADGIDISAESVNYASNTLGLNVWNKSLMEFNTNKRYDVVLMFDVIEHLVEPNSSLSKCRSLLKKDGLLYLQVPNLLGFKLPWNHGYGLPYHLWQFSFKTLSRLLGKNGFKVVGYWTGPMGVIGEYEKNRHIFLKEMMWKAASRLYLGNRLQVIARISGD